MIDQINEIKNDPTIQVTIPPFSSSNYTYNPIIDNDNYINNLNPCCNFCNKTFNSIQEKEKHNKKYHLGDFICEICTINFNNFDLLTLHEKLKHPFLYNHNKTYGKLMPKMTTLKKNIAAENSKIHTKKIHPLAMLGLPKKEFSLKKKIQNY